MNTNEPCAAVFPVDEDFMRLPNNDVIQLEGRQQKITYYLTLGGWNISSPNHIINVIDKFDFSQLDVLVLVNSYHFLEHMDQPPLCLQWVYQSYVTLYLYQQRLHCK